MSQGRSGTGPFGKHRKGVDYKLLSARIHRTDHDHLVSRLQSEGLPYSDFLRAIIESYLSADPQLIRIVADWKKRNKIPPSKKQRDSMTFSPTEIRRIELLMHGAGHDDDGEAV